MEAQTSIKVKKYLELARKIILDENLDKDKADWEKQKYGRDIDPSVLVGVAAMLQLEAMSAPMIVVNNEGQAQNLHIDDIKDSEEGGSSN